MKLPELVTWVMPHALLEGGEAQEDETRTSSEKISNSVKQSGKLKIIHTYEELELKILDQDEAAVVYFASNDDKPGMPLLVRLSEQIADFVNVVYFPIEDREEFKQNFRGKLP